MEWTKFVAGIAAGLALVCASTFSYGDQQQDRQRDQEAQQGQAVGGQQRIGAAGNQQRIDVLWQQIGKLHEQIVALEVAEGITSEASPARGSAERRLRSDIEDRAPDRPQDAGQRDEPAPGQTRRPRPGEAGQSPRPFGAPGASASGTANVDELWKQVARVHRQLVGMVANQRGGQPGAARPQTSTPARPPGLTSPRPGEEDQPRREPGERPTGRPQPGAEPFASQPGPMQNQLIEQYAQLHLQIIQQEVASQPSSSAPRFGAPDRPEQRKQSDRPNPPEDSDSP